MKADVQETEYPMLCEGTRRRRGELALTLLDYAKDNPVWLQQVKECLLDKNRYRLEKHPHGQRKRANKKKKGKTDRAFLQRRGGFGVPAKRLGNKAGYSNVHGPIPLSGVGYCWWFCVRLNQ